MRDDGWLSQMQCGVPIVCQSQRDNCWMIMVVHLLQSDEYTLSGDYKRGTIFTLSLCLTECATGTTLPKETGYNDHTENGSLS